MANGARMEGIEANLFFTFFGLDAIRRDRSANVKVATVGNPGLHLPTIVGVLPGISALMTSKMMQRKMEKLDIPPIPEFIELISDSGAGLYACKATVDMFGLTKEDFLDAGGRGSSRWASSTRWPPEARSSSPSSAGLDSARGRADAVRAARAELRPLRVAALVRAGPALAAVPRLADRGGARRPRARRRDRDGRGRARARAAEGLHGRRRRPERGDARGGAAARRRPASSSSQASAEQLPFADGEFDALTFTYLLRYVDDPAATLRELARVVPPGRDDRRARVRRAARPLAAGLGAATCASACPAAGRADRPRLARGRLVPRPVDPRLLRALAASRGCSRPGARPGSTDVQARRLSLGGGIVTWGRRT